MTTKRKPGPAPAAPAPATSTARVRALFERRAAAGLTEVRGAFAHPDDHALVKAYAKGLAEARARRGD